MEEVLKDIEKGSEDATQASLALFNSKVHTCTLTCILSTHIAWVIPSIVLLHVWWKRHNYGSVIHVDYK